MYWFRLLCKSPSTHKNPPGLSPGWLHYTVFIANQLILQGNSSNLT